MTIAQDIQKSALPAYVELFDFDFSSTNIPELAETIFRCTPNIAGSEKVILTELSDFLVTESLDKLIALSASEVVFGGDTYVGFPLQISGINQSSEGAPARPQLTIANVSKYFGYMSFAYNDIIGTTVTFTRTFEPYLGTSSRISLPPLRYYIAKKTHHDKTLISFELRDFRDKERAFLPKRQMLKKDFPGLGINKNVR